MKIFATIATILTVILLAVVWVGTVELHKERQLQQREIDGQKKLIEQKEKALSHAYDSLAQTKILYADSLREARDLLKDCKK